MDEIKVTHTHDPVSGTMLVDVSGRFEPTSYQTILQPFSEASSKPEKVELNFSKVSYLGMAGTGVLLLLRDYLGGDETQITILEPTEEVNTTLTTFNLDQLFEIRSTAE